jgi:hypothetical protein
VGENTEGIDYKIGSEELFHIDESIEGRELLIDFVYGDASGYEYEKELRGVLDELADKRLVSAQHLKEHSGLSTLDGWEMVEEILSPLLNRDEMKYPVVLKYRADGDLFYFLSTLWISSDLDLSWQERKRIESFIGGWKTLRQVKKERGVDKELVYDFWQD